MATKSQYAQLVIKIAFFYLKADHRRTGHLDLDLAPMTLIYELDLDILKICLPTENELSV